MEFRKIALTALVLTIACLSPFSIAIEKAKPIINTKPIILWDLHGVVLQSKNKDTIGKMVSTFFKYDKKREALYTQNSIALIKGMFAMTRQLFGLGATGEEFMAVARDHGDHAMAELILQLLTCQTLNTGTVAIIKKLHELEYKQHIGSNMGQEYEFAGLLAKQEPEFQEIFHAIFDLQASQLVNYAAKPPLKKPNPEFFTAYLAKNNIAPEQVIFIDDNLCNCQAAQAVGIAAIWFRNPEQLAAELKKRGIEI